MSLLFQHYLPPGPPTLPFVPGRFYASAHARAVGSAAAVTANRLYAVPYLLPRSGRFDAMAISITGASTGFLRMALARDDDAGRPGHVIEEPVVDVDTAAPGTALCPFTAARWIGTGAWWVLLCFSGTPTVRGTSSQAFSGGNTLLLGSTVGDGGAGGGGGSENGFMAALTYQAGEAFLPSPPTGLGYLGNALTPVPSLRAA